MFSVACGVKKLQLTVGPVGGSALLVPVLSRQLRWLYQAVHETPVWTSDLMIVASSSTPLVGKSQWRPLYHHICKCTKKDNRYSSRYKKLLNEKDSTALCNNNTNMLGKQTARWRGYMDELIALW